MIRTGMLLEVAGGRSAISKQALVTLIAECALLRRSRTPEPTLTAERWFLSVCYPKASWVIRPAVVWFAFVRGQRSTTLVLILPRSRVDIETL
jgi:hypothetical protein